MDNGVLILCLECFIGLVLLEVEPVAGRLLELVLNGRGVTCVRVGF